MVEELRGFTKDQALILFIFILPLAYPVIYSWIYNNEVLHEVPVVVVDRSNTHTSREFIRRYDATPSVHVAFKATSIEEAKSIVGHQKANGVIYIPSDFETKLLRMEQSHISVYCDMSIMLAYKNIYQSAMAVSSEMNAGIQCKVTGNYTDREDEILTQPLAFDEVPIFNTTGGYANCVIPAVLILIIQQSLLLAMGFTNGTRRDRVGHIFPEYYTSLYSMIPSRMLAYLLVYAVVAAYMLLAIPAMFSIVSIIYAKDLVLLILPYLLACIFFAMFTMTAMLQREDALIIVVFTSIILLFMTGVSWPLTNIPPFWRGFSWLFPSTFGIQGFVKMNTMGARIADVRFEVIVLWIQTFVYAILTTIVYWRLSLKLKK